MQRGAASLTGKPGFPGRLLQSRIAKRVNVE
jgi:hypothetical protein